MPEQQNTEWKESWRDEYLKWVCGFANAEGGKLLVGVNDKGKVVGIPNAAKLLEDLPNKIKSILGVLVEVSLQQEDGKDYLEIVTDQYPYPVSFRGRYFKRSGSTMQELIGNDLNKFLLEKVGKTWDAVPVPGVTTDDLSNGAFDRYREKAVLAGRIDKEILEDADEILIENLRLMDNAYLKRAAVLLFHADPEKFLSGAFIKIGFFKTDDDLLFQDEVHGNLMKQIDQTIDLLKTKYSTNMIEYSGMSRVEKSPFPEDALREALLNAIAHKDYGVATPIQISVYPDCILFWNPGKLPGSLTIEKLSQKHPSVPFNPDLANGLFRSGDIESWGRGTIRMIKACLKHQILPPLFNNDDVGFMVTLFIDVDNRLKEMGFTSSHSKVVLEGLAGRKINNKLVQEVCGVSKATATRYLEDLDGIYIERVGETGRGTYYKIKGS